MKWILIIIGIIIVLIIVVYFVGRMLPLKHKASHSEKYPFPKELIWQKITEIENHKKWRKDIKSIEILDDKTWKEIDRHNNVVTYGIIESEDEKKLVVKIMDENLPWGGSWTYELEESNGETVLIITENGEIYNPIFRFISHIFMDQNATKKKFMKYLKDELELNRN